MGFGKLGRRDKQTASRSPNAAPWMKGLTDIEIQIIREYLVDLNRTQAMLRVRPELDYNTAGVRASELFGKVHIIEALDLALEANGAGPRQWLINKLAAIADSSIDHFFDWLPHDGVITLKKGEDVPKAVRALIKEIRLKENGEVVLKLHDPLKAMELLAQVRGIALTAQQHDHKHTVGLDQLLGSYSPPEPAQVAAPDPMKQIASAIDAEFEAAK
jgi:hypothetical protein